jgi:hypothetical protein
VAVFDTVCGEPAEENGKALVGFNHEEAGPALYR